MQERPSAPVTLMPCGIVSGYSPPCSIVSKRRPVPFMLGSWGRFSGVISSNLWVSFIRRLSSVSVAPNVCLSALNQPPERGRGSMPLAGELKCDEMATARQRYRIIKRALATGFDRLAQPLHREFDTLRLQ